MTEKTQAASGANRAGELVPDVSLAKMIEEEIRGGRVELPVLPEIAEQVREIVARDGNVSDLVAVIEREPAFAAAVLRYSNSVAYAGLREVVDLRQAVTRLGLAAVEQTILAIAAKNAFQSTGPEDEAVFRALWNHAIVTALAARRLAARAPGVGAELAFLGGLLHDIGKVVILRCAASVRKRSPQRAISETALIEFFDALHCRVGDSLFDSWRLPKEIRDVVRRHHEERLEGPEDMLVAIVAVANRMAAKLGASLHPDPSLSLVDCSAAALLRLDDLRLATILVDVEDDVQRLNEAL